MSKFTYYRNIMLSIICIVFGVCIGYVNLTQQNSGFPNKSHLVEKSGYVDWVQSYKYGIRFSYVDDPLNFNYPSKSDGQGVVEKALLGSDGNLVTILYEAEDDHSPIYSEKVYNDFFELMVGDKLVRSYSESERAWKSDNKLMPFIMAFFLLGGPFIWWKSNKEYKNA